MFRQHFSNAIVTRVWTPDVLTDISQKTVPLFFFQQELTRLSLHYYACDFTRKYWVWIFNNLKMILGARPGWTRKKHIGQNNVLVAKMDRQIPALAEQNLHSVVLVTVWSLFHRPDDIWDSKMCPWRVTIGCVQWAGDKTTFRQHSENSLTSSLRDWDQKVVGILQRFKSSATNLLLNNCMLQQRPKCPVLNQLQLLYMLWHEPLEQLQIQSLCTTTDMQSLCSNGCVCRELNVH